MNPDLFSAILSMDAYNRGYGAGIDLSLGGTQIGDATIVQDSSVLTDTSGDRLDQPASFYAVAYDWNGETVISYRGSDYVDPDGTLIPNDVWDGWTATAGWTSGQVGLAIDFYEHVAGQSISGTTPTDISTTGHIASISLATVTPETGEIGGNLIMAEGVVTMTDGSTIKAGDVVLDISQVSTEYLGTTTVSGAAAVLPELRGFGTMADLRIAMSEDAVANDNVIARQAA